MFRNYFWTLYRVLTLIVALSIGTRLTNLWVRHTTVPLTRVSWRRVMQRARSFLEYPHDFGCKFQGYKDAMRRVSWGRAT
jgi:hypothetical protein